MKLAVISNKAEGRAGVKVVKVATRIIYFASLGKPTRRLHGDAERRRGTETWDGDVERSPGRAWVTGGRRRSRRLIESRAILRVGNGERLKRITGVGASN
jgi:hypothetical protein